MTLARILLGVIGAVFAGYGLACLVSPALPAGYAGLDLVGASGATEVAAMYGGLQLGLGILLLRAAVAPAHVMLGLTVLVTLVGGLALGRTFGLLVHGPTDYNVAAWVFELSTTILGIVAIRLVARDLAAAPGS